MISARAVGTEKASKQPPINPILDDGGNVQPLSSGGSIPTTSFKKLIIDEFEYFISGFYGDDRMRTDVYDEIMEHIKMVREVFE